MRKLALILGLLPEPSPPKPVEPSAPNYDPSTRCSTRRLSLSDGTSIYLDPGGQIAYYGEGGLLSAPVGILPTVLVVPTFETAISHRLPSGMDPDTIALEAQFGITHMMREYAVFMRQMVGDLRIQFESTHGAPHAKS